MERGATAARGARVPRRAVRRHGDGDRREHRARHDDHQRPRDARAVAGPLARDREGADVGRLVLGCGARRSCCIALLAYAYHRNTVAPASLASIGLLAFAAVAQFAPATRRRSVLAGRDARGSVLGTAGRIRRLALHTAAAQPARRRRDRLAAVRAGTLGHLVAQAPDAVRHRRDEPGDARRDARARTERAGAGAGLSRLRGVSLRERMAATTFLRGGMPVAGVAAAGGARVGDLLAVDRADPRRRSRRTRSRDYHAGGGRPVPRPSEPADRGLLQYMERVLAGAIGASSARLMFTHAMAGRGIAPEDVAELLDETSQELRFSRQLLQATMENVAQGIAVADAEGHIVAWNRRYLEMFDYPDGMVFVGRPVADLIRWNAKRGEFGAWTSEQQIEKRLAHMKAGTSLRHPAHAPQWQRLRDPRPAASGRRLRHDVQRHHRIQAHRAGAARGQADAGAARRGAHEGAAGRARGAGGRQAAGRGGQRDQDTLRGGGQP